MSSTSTTDVVAAEKRIAETEKIAQMLERHWARLMPQGEIPDRAQFYLWSSRHHIDAMLYAIARTARKLKTLNGRMDLDYLLRYCSKCMNNATASAGSGDGK